MDNEQSLNIGNEEKSGGISFARILYILRSHILLIAIITLLFAVGGFAYAKTRKPVYTSSVPVQFNVQVNTGDETDRVASVNYLLRYIDTAVGICGKGIVLDRANVYYHFYKESGKKIDAFIDDIKAAYTDDVKETRGEIPGYEVTDELINKYRGAWFTSGKVKTSYSSSKKDTEMVINFSLSVSDFNGETARDMACIYALAADVSLNQVLAFGDATAGLTELWDSSRDVGYSSNANTKKPVIIAFVLGLIVSVAVVYLIYLADNTVKSKQQLEQRSGANVIAYIEDVAEVK